MGSIPAGRSNVGVWPSGYGTWFGTRRPVVRIHLPRPTKILQAAALISTKSNDYPLNFWLPTLPAVGILFSHTGPLQNVGRLSSLVLA